MTIRRTFVVLTAAGALLSTAASPVLAAPLPIASPAAESGVQQVQYRRWHGHDGSPLSFSAMREDFFMPQPSSKIQMALIARQPSPAIDELANYLNGSHGLETT